MFFWRAYLYDSFLNWFGGRKYIIYLILTETSNLLWRSFYLSFYADELFASIIDVFFRQYCIMPAIFIFDRWLLLLMGTILVKNLFGWINKYVFVLRFSILDIVFSSIQVSLLLVIGVYLSTYIINYVL